MNVYFRILSLTYVVFLISACGGSDDKEDPINVDVTINEGSTDVSVTPGSPPDVNVGPTTVEVNGVQQAPTPFEPVINVTQVPTPAPQVTVNNSPAPATPVVVQAPSAPALHPASAPVPDPVVNTNPEEVQVPEPTPVVEHPAPPSSPHAPVASNCQHEITGEFGRWENLTARAGKQSEHRLAVWVWDGCRNNRGELILKTEDGSTGLEIKHSDQYGHTVLEVSHETVLVPQIMGKEAVNRIEIWTDSRGHVTDIGIGGSHNMRFPAGGTITQMHVHTSDGSLGAVSFALTTLPSFAQTH